MTELAAGGGCGVPVLRGNETARVGPHARVKSSLHNGAYDTFSQVMVRVLIAPVIGSGDGGVDR